MNDQDATPYDGKETTVGEVKKGDLVQFRGHAAAPVWVRDEYNREAKAFEFYAFDDVNRFISRKKTVKCFIGFTY